MNFSWPTSNSTINPINWWCKRYTTPAVTLFIWESGQFYSYRRIKFPSLSNAITIARTMTGDTCRYCNGYLIHWVHVHCWSSWRFAAVVIYSQIHHFVMWVLEHVQVDQLGRVKNYLYKINLPNTRIDIPWSPLPVSWQPTQSFSTIAHLHTLRLSSL